MTRSEALEHLEYLSLEWQATMHRVAQPTWEEAFRREPLPGQPSAHDRMATALGELVAWAHQAGCAGLNTDANVDEGAVEIDKIHHWLAESTSDETWHEGQPLSPLVLGCVDALSAIADALRTVAYQLYDMRPIKST